MGVGVQGLIDAISLMIFIFLNAGRAKKEEVGLIEDENQDHLKTSSLFRFDNN